MIEELTQESGKVSPQKIATDSMERYSGSRLSEFGEYLLITNFPKYVDYFASARGLPVKEGSTFKVAHSKKENVSILDFKMGSPMAALVVDLCAYLPIKGVMMLGMAGGLRDRFEVGDFFIPVGSIRGDGTSDFYFPPEVPALGNFLLQRLVSEELEAQQIKYHMGITHTTNRRFWEFNEEFKQHILVTRPQAIEMECATLFIASYKHKVPLGALLLISDLPLKPDGIKTKESAEYVFNTFTAKHVEVGVQVLKRLEKWHVGHSSESPTVLHPIEKKVAKKSKVTPSDKKKPARVKSKKEADSEKQASKENSKKLKAQIVKKVKAKDPSKKRSNGKS